MGGTISITSGELRQGARDARAVADVVDLARQASAAALPGNAFGFLCSPLFLPIYSVVQTAADLMMDAATTGLERAAGNLDGVAASFEAEEDYYGGAFRAVQAR
ncbi:MAG TPA: hypothetical protein PLE12_11065 [Propionicimonas sp.]|jgi:hypothetical protein|nr:hypothetical protein [Propionicimonas sp.]